MSAICTCRNAIIKTTEHDEAYCDRCGFWWDERHGSIKPGDPLPEARKPNNQYHRPTPKIGRNDPCPCGSGSKFKKCCGP